MYFYTINDLFYRSRIMLKTRQISLPLALIVSSEKIKFITYYKYIICSRPFPEASWTRGKLNVHHERAPFYISHKEVEGINVLFPFIIRYKK